MHQLFAKLCQEKFQFLVEEFGFNEPEVRDDRYFCNVVYRNETAGVKIHYEWKDQAAWVVLMRLVNGQEPDLLSDRVNQHGLWAVVQLRAGPEARLNESTATEAEMEQVLAQDAHALRTYAADILRGDFSLFPELYKLKQA